jgi:hypothetical protein
MPAEMGTRPAVSDRIAVVGQHATKAIAAIRAYAQPPAAVARLIRARVGSSLA